MRTLALVFTLLLAAPATAAFDASVLVGPGGSAFDAPPEVAATDAGAFTVLWTSGSSFSARTSPAGSGTFAPATLTGTGASPSLAVAGGGAAVVASRSSATAVGVAYRPSATEAFATPASLPATSAGKVAAGIDDAGNAVAAFKDGAAIKVALSAGATFGAVETAPAAVPAAAFEAGDGDQLDVGPRAFRDNLGNVVLVYRSGANAYAVRRTAGGDWTVADLGPADDVKADADPASLRVLIAVQKGSTLTVYEGASSTGGFAVVHQPTNASAQFGVGVRAGGTETLVTYRRSGGDLIGASCRDAYMPAVVAGSNPGVSSAAAAVTGGHDGVVGWSAFVSGETAARGNSRDPGGSWALPVTLQDTNLGGVGAGAGRDGRALVAWVATGGSARGAFYAGSPPVATTQCAAVPVDVEPPPTETPTATPVYTIPTAVPSATPTVTPPTDRCAPARARLAKAERALKRATKKLKRLKRKRAKAKKVKRARKARTKARKAVRRARAAVAGAC